MTDNLSTVLLPLKYNSTLFQNHVKMKLLTTYYLRKTTNNANRFTFNIRALLEIKGTNFPGKKSGILSRVKDPLQ